MGHAISNLALGVGQSFLCRREGVGHVFFINHISKCFGPPHPRILFDQSLKAFKDFIPDVSTIGTHSLRSGGATAAANVPHRLFKRHDR